MPLNGIILTPVRSCSNYLSAPPPEGAVFATVCRPSPRNKTRRLQVMNNMVQDNKPTFISYVNKSGDTSAAQSPPPSQLLFLLHPGDDGRKMERSHSTREVSTFKRRYSQNQSQISVTNLFKLVLPLAQINTQLTSLILKSVLKHNIKTSKQRVAGLPCRN